MPIVKSPVGDSSLRKTSKPIIQKKSVPIQPIKVGKIVSIGRKLATANSSNTNDNSMKYTAVWDETDKKFKVTRVDKAEELITKFDKYVHCALSS